MFSRNWLPFVLITALALIHESVFPPQLMAAQRVVESAREIPVAYDVDVVVVGGTTGGVSAALAAAEQGASVFLAAPRPYLGEDVCGTLRLWLEPGEEPTTAFERQLFEAGPSQQAFAARLPFQYEADLPSDAKHRDGDPPSRLTDGRWGSASTDSVQFNDDVTIVANLGGNKRVKQLHLLVYQRSTEFEVADIQVWTSPNGTLWRDLGKVKNPMAGKGVSEDNAIDLSLEIKQPCSYVKVLVHKAENAERVLLGELVVVEDRPVAPQVATTRVPPTPMQVKYALDQALIDAGVTFLYGSPVTDLLRDADGRVAGIVMANRAGRQAVKAKVVIDATMRASAARLGNTKFEPYPTGLQSFERVVVGGASKTADGMQMNKAPVQFTSKEGTHDVYVYSLQLPMNDGGVAAFAEAEQLARDKTFDAALVDEADFLFQVPPDPIHSRANSTIAAFDAAAVMLDVCQPADTSHLFVLSGCADVSREAAAQLMRPLNWMRLGSRVGAAAAELAKSRTLAGDLALFCDPPSNADNEAEVREFLSGVRPTHSQQPTIASAERSLPVLGEYDVVVIGGGTGGAPAAIGAGRKGAKTLLVEYQDHLGGVGTLGLISSYYHGYRKGFSAEVDQAVAAMGGPQRRGGWNPITKREYWRAEARKAGSDIWFSSLGCGALVRDGYVVGAIVATPQGRGVVLAHTVVDSTGNAEIAEAAGAKTITTSAEHVAMQGTGLSPRALGTGYTNTDYSFSDESDPVDQWRMIVSARRKFKSSYDISTFIDSRERRRIQGEVFITPLDLMNGRTYRDTIAMHQSNFDTHGYTVHPVFLINFPDKKQMTVPVPYRALLPKGLDGVLVTGLGISAHRDSMPILRMQACIQNQGYAAGVAAAMAAEERTSTRSINMRVLQQHLVEIGSLESPVLEQEDSPPPSAEAVAEAVRSVVREYRGLAIILDQSEVALPLLRDAYQAETVTENKLVYANILGMLGDATGAPTLIAEIDKSPWDAGWNFRGMGQFGGSISQLDSHIIALGRSGAKDALPVILKKVEELDSEKEFSHHRAVSMALESLRDTKAAPALAKLLAKEGMTGFAITEISSEAQLSGNEHRSQPLREIILARALYRCGDYNDAAKQILTTYEQDLRGLFAQHAQAVLHEKQ
ncbi:MAG: FAD-dependent oxidoreductase [Planctomycetales bacterium]|nr:FAD-dependent oxidoreductase [Planctomycetales bacterium]